MTLLSKAGPDAGFTLIELVVVMAIMGVMIAMVTLRGAPTSPATHARASARALSGALRAARSEAIMTNSSVAITIDTNKGLYQWGKRPVESLPPDIRVALMTGRDQQSGDGVGQFRFDPDGGSSGGRVAVTGGDRTYWVGIDWLTGRVSLAEKPH